MYAVIETKNGSPEEVSLIDEKDRAYDYAEQRREETVDWIKITVQPAFYQS